MEVPVANFQAEAPVRTFFCLMHHGGLNSPSQVWMTGNLGLLSFTIGLASALAISWDSTVEIAGLDSGDQIAQKSDSW